MNPKHRPIHLMLQAGVRKYRTTDLMLAPAHLKDCVADLCLIKPVLGVVRGAFCGSNGRLDVSNQLREVGKRPFPVSRSSSDPTQVENCGRRRAARSFKYPKRSFKSLAPCDRWPGLGAVGALCLMPGNARAREPPRPRIVQDSRDKKRKSENPQATTPKAKTHTPGNRTGEHDGEVSKQRGGRCGCGSAHR